MVLAVWNSTRVIRAEQADGKPIGSEMSTSTDVGQYWIVPLVLGCWQGFVRITHLIVVHLWQDAL
jgi:hypothetical protein